MQPEADSSELSFTGKVARLGLVHVASRWRWLLGLVTGVEGRVGMVGWWWPVCCPEQPEAVLDQQSPASIRALLKGDPAPATLFICLQLAWL